MQGPGGDFVRFLFLTTLRRTEAAHLHQNEMAADFSQLRVGADRYKTNVEFVLPLSDPAAKLLRGRPPVEWFFSLDGERPLSHFSDLKKEIDKRSGVTGWRLHDVRRTAATGPPWISSRR
jgi:integrase